MDYPVWDIAIGGGTLMAIVAISHVIVSHFAIGGGLLIAVTETLSVRRKDDELRELARRGSLVLILLSTVYGAISGVGIWVVAGLISPGAISALIHEYVWAWAIEWTFFVVEIVAALIYYSTWNKVSKGTHLMVGWIYFVTAYLSLVVINGIITFMLTPGRWLETFEFWDGFFNPTYWPGLVLRTGICAMMAIAFLVFLIGRAKPEAQPRIGRYLSYWLFGGTLVAYAGYRWWEASLPEPALGLFRGDSPVLSSLATTRSLTLWALLVTLILAAVLFAIRSSRVRGITALLLAIAAMGFFGGYERLREGTRKPFLIHSHLFSNGLLVEDIQRINSDGMQQYSGWVAMDSQAGTEEYGRAVFLAQCASCHTLDGYQAIRPLLPTTSRVLAVAADEPPGSGEEVFRSVCASCHADYSYEEMQDTVPTPEEILEAPEDVHELNLAMIAATLEELRDMGDFYAEIDRSQTIDTHQTAYPQMPPFVGTDDDLEALAAYLASLDEGLADSSQSARQGAK